MSVYEYLDAAEVAPWLYRGCWADARAGRIMSVVQVKGSMTNDVSEREIRICREACSP